MKANLTKEQSLFHIENGKKIKGKNSRLTGDCSRLRGDCSGLCGDIDSCQISDAERKGGIYISSLIKEAKK